MYMRKKRWILVLTVLAVLVLAVIGWRAYRFAGTVTARTCLGLGNRGWSSTDGCP